MESDLWDFAKKVNYYIYISCRFLSHSLIQNIFPSWVAKVAATVAVRRLPLSVPKALFPPTHTHRHMIAHVKAQGQTHTRT